MNERRRAGRPPDLPSIEHVSQLVHATWCQRMRTRGIVSRPSVDGFEQLVDWWDLPDEGRELDRELVQAVYQAIFRAWRAEHQNPRN